MSAALSVEPLWRTALVGRERERLASTSRGARARLALQAVLAKAGETVSLVTIHGWTRAEQGSAYLWAVAFALGREDLPPPSCVWDARKGGR